MSVRAGELPPWEPPAPDATSWVERRPHASETRCVYESVGRFLVRGGSEIVVDARPGTDPGLVRHALIGPVLAQLLWQRGLFTLHASVVRIAGRAVGFLGESGEGKSTTAAALDAAGHALVCDDIAAIPWQSLPIRALPGFPRMRLYADSVSSVGEDPNALPHIHTLLDKRLKPARDFVREPVVLHALYVLERGDAFRVEPLPKQGAMIALLKNSYNPSQLAPIVGFGTHMQMAATVAEHVRAYRLERPRDLARLPELGRLLETHVAS